MDHESCPLCGGSILSTGRVLHNSIRALGLFFEPGEVARWWSTLLGRKGVPIGGEFRSCLSCGLCWTDVSARELRALIGRHGNREAKRQVELYDKGPGKNKVVDISFTTGPPSLCC